MAPSPSGGLHPTNPFENSMKPLLYSAVITAMASGSPLHAALTIPGNGNNGFGGAVGGGSLAVTDDGVNLSFTFTRGSGGNFNDTLVIYFDTVSGGATALPTSGEIGSPFVGRRAIVNEFGSGFTFSSGFGSDFAFALKASGSASNHLFTTPSGANANTLGFVSTHTVSNFGSASAATYQWTIPVTNLGLTANSGATFRLITTYLNPNGGDGSDASFRSNEAFGYSMGSNPGFSGFTAPSAVSYTIVPEPGAAWIGLIGSSLLLRRRRA